VWCAAGSFSLSQSHSESNLSQSPVYNHKGDEVIGFTWAGTMTTTHYPFQMKGKCKTNWITGRTQGCGKKVVNFPMYKLPSEGTTQGFSQNIKTKTSKSLYVLFLSHSPVSELDEENKHRLECVLLIFTFKYFFLLLKPGFTCPFCV